MEQQRRKLLTYTAGEKNVYLISMAGQNIVYNIIGATLAYYLQFTLSIHPMAVGLIMGIARFWDAINDFIMGTLVDKTRTKWGKCRPYLLFVPIPILVITVLCFVNFGVFGQGTQAMDVLIVGWAALTYVLWGMVYTIGDIPLWGITALMTEDNKDRDKLLSLARIFGGIGGGVTMLAMQPLALGLGTALTETVGDPISAERWGFFIAALIFAIIGCGLFQLCGFKVRERIVSSEKVYTLKENFKIMLGNKPFKQILLSGILGSPKMLLMLAAMPLVTYYFATKDGLMALMYMALLGGGMFIGNFLGMAYTPKMLKKFSKKNLYNWAHLVAIIPYSLIFVAYLASPRGAMAENPLLIGAGVILFFICGASMGITMVLQSSMIADCVDYEEYNTGTRPDGVFFAGQTFLAKLTTGFATIVSSVAYTIVGFTDTRVSELNDYIASLADNPSLDLPRHMAEYDSFMTVLFFLVSIPPAIGCLLSVIPTWRYSLDDDVHSKIIDELNSRRHANDDENNEQ